MAEQSVGLGLPGVGVPRGPGVVPSAPLRVRVAAGGGAATLALHVAGAGLACCSVELVAAALRSPDAVAAGLLPADDAGPSADVLVVSGTLTDVLAPALRELYDALPVGTPVLSFGACAASGGPYWDSYSVARGIGEVVPVDVYVPGCPPRPEALADGLRLIAGVAS